MLSSRIYSNILVGCFCHSNVEERRRYGCDTPATSAVLFQDPRRYLLWRGCSALAWAYWCCTEDCGGVRCPQLQPTALELLWKLPWFWGCQYVKNGNVNSWSSLSGNTAFAPGKIGAALFQQYSSSIFISGRRKPVWSRFLDVVGTPEPHTTSAR